MSINNPHVNDPNHTFPIPKKFKVKDSGPAQKKTKNVVEGKK